MAINHPETHLVPAKRPSRRLIPMSSGPFPTPEAEQILTKIRSRRGAAKSVKGYENPGYLNDEYERDIREVLVRLFPYSVLSNLRLFSAENRLQRELGIEIDNLMHFRLEGTDYVVVVEAKNQELQVTGDKWIATYDDGEKCAREQVDKHVRTLWEYLEPISRDIELKFVAIVCCVGQVTPEKKAGYRNAELHLTSIDGLTGLLGSRFNLKSNSGSRAEILRVTQSGFLDLLRLSLPVPELGHPELASSIRYVERCRRSLDETLFQDFKPTSERWVINGSAGMGKSVLLAYTAAVLCSGHELHNFQGEVWVRKADDIFAKIGFKTDHNQGTIGIMAMSAKQLENIREWFELFVANFQKADKTGDVRFRQPEFILCRDAELVGAVARRCRALLVDEAHDLPQFAAREIATIHQEKGFYLVVACDRHQRLRLAGSDARIIEGLDFSLKSIRLKQIYRNPAPVYIASLALMFRWFALDGPKVIPTAKELADHFGFVANNVAGNGISLSMMSDAHPANSWCHTVATYPNANAAYTALARERVGHQEVLWVRFSEEDPDFDYELLLRNFTYHNCRSRDAHKISDKYVKGQEYPIVVIEGFPSFMDRFTDGEKPREQEDKMWAFRRELYLCASRATCFLYFICNVPETEEVSRIKAELGRLVEAVALPKNLGSGGARTWSLFLKETDPKNRRNLEVFADATSPVVEEEESAAVIVPPPRKERQPIVAPPPPRPTPVAPPPKNPFDVLNNLLEATPPEQVEMAAQPTESISEPAAIAPAEAPAPVIASPPPAPEPPPPPPPPPPPAEDAFKSRLSVPGPMSVMQFSRELGVRHREVMFHATRLGKYTTGGTVLDIGTMRMIAAKFGFGLVVSSPGG